MTSPEPISALRVGAPAMFHMRGHGERSFIGSIERIGPPLIRSPARYRCSSRFPTPKER